MTFKKKNNCLHDFRTNIYETSVFSEMNICQLANVTETVKTNAQLEGI